VVVSPGTEAERLSALWRVGAATTLAVLGFATVNPMLAVELQRAGASASAIGVFATLPFITIALALPLLPGVFARLGAARAYRLGLALETVCIAGYALGDGYLLWCACSVLGSVGAAAVWNGTEAMVAFNAPPAARGRFTGLYQTALGGALAVGPFVPGLAQSVWAAMSPRAVVLASSALFFVALLLVAGRSLRLLPVALPEARGQTLWSALRAQPALAWIALAGGVFEAGLGSISAAHGSQLGLSAASATSIAGAVGVGSLLLQYPAGWLADRIALRRVFALAAGVLLIGSVSFAFTPAWPPLLWVSAFLWGAVGGALYTLTMVRVAHDFARASAMAGTAAMITGYTVGGAIGPAFSGVMLDAFGVMGQSTWLTLLSASVLVVALRSAPGPR
jgi:MFS family permease